MENPVERTHAESSQGSGTPQDKLVEEGHSSNWKDSGWGC